MALPPSPSPPSVHISPLHYALSSKMKAKKSKIANDFKPLPPEPKTLPPPSKPPFPEPKPPALKNMKKKPTFSRQRKDVYVAESSSDSDNDDNGDGATLSLPSRSNVPMGTKKPPYINLNVGPPGEDVNMRPPGVVDAVDVGEHVYDTAEVPEEAKRRARKTLKVEEVIGRTGSSGSHHHVSPPPSSQNGTSPLLPRGYQNVEPDPSYDENPTLPPRAHPPSYEDAPNLPPRHQISDSSNMHIKPPLKKKAGQPLPPPKQKVGPTPPPKFPPTTPLPPAATPKSSFVATPPTTKRKAGPPPLPGKPDKHSNCSGQLSELSQVLSNRNARGGQFTPPMNKKSSWKRGEPQLPPKPAGGMTNFV